jgi:NAD(P)-dependent dehydrogenase (short-subunit alcohol dehydrogenase family)
MKNNSDYSAIIIGAGVATGSALTKKFAQEGYKVCPVRRERSMSELDILTDQIKSDGGWAQGFGIDARDEDSIVSLFKEVEETMPQLM